MLRQAGPPPATVDVEAVDAPDAAWRIVVLDEACAVREKMGSILSVLGFAREQVELARDVEEARMSFALHAPHLVFMEFPAGGDASLVGEFLAMDPGLRVVLVTAEGPASDLVRAAVRMGVFAVVEKPLRHDKIRLVVSEARAEEGGVERFR